MMMMIDDCILPRVFVWRTGLGVKWGLADLQTGELADPVLTSRTQMMIVSRPMTVIRPSEQMTAMRTMAIK